MNKIEIGETTETQCISRLAGYVNSIGGLPQLRRSATFVETCSQISKLRRSGIPSFKLDVA